MSKFTDAQNDLVRKIVSGECLRNQVPEELHRIEESFPNERFGTSVPKRKEKPWDMDYLRYLEELFYHGADSKAYIEYIAEVSEEVYRAKRVRKVLLCALLIVAAVALIAVLAKTLLGD